MTERPVIDRLLDEIRRALPPRPQAADLEGLLARGALVIDIRPVHQREAHGELPDAVVIDRNILEWRLDPTSPYRIPEADRPVDAPIVVVCHEGYSSTLAAEALQRIGLTGATELAGGYQAWLAWSAGRHTQA